MRLMPSFSARPSPFLAPVASVLALAAWPVLADAVLVAPHALFLSDRSRVGQVELINQGRGAEEVEIEFAYGYPQTDSTGDMHVELIENPPADAPSAAGWLRAFPRRLRLDPGQRQSVRIQASPPAGLRDGEYWSRMIVTSRPAQAGGVSEDSTINAAIVFQLRTITSVNYRNGTVRTGVRIDSVTATATADTLDAWVSLTRTGNAAFIGSVRLALADSTGTTVRSWDPSPLAVYYGLFRRFQLPLEGLAAGRYTLRVSATTERQDLDPRHVLPVEPVTFSRGVEVR